MNESDFYRLESIAETRKDTEHDRELCEHQRREEAEERDNRCPNCGSIWVMRWDGYFKCEVCNHEWGGI
jgi:formate dehydrogenase maturation protein FdhE